MTDPEFDTTYTARWVGDDYTGIPRRSVASMVADDIAARREAEELAAAAEDAREAVAMRCRGRDTSMAGVFARAERGFRQTDYADAKQETASRMTDSGYLRDRPVRRLSDDDLRSMALQAEVRQLERKADLERTERDRLLQQARDRHPVSAAWPAWGPR